MARNKKVIKLKNNKFLKGFTLIELLVVIAIIAILAGLVIIRISEANKNARDSKRLADVDQIQKALEMYKIKNGQYPGNTDNDCSGWDTGFNGGQGSGDQFIQPLITSGEMSQVPGDPTSTGNCAGYRYYRYSAGTSGCNASSGAFYVLGIADLETSSGVHPSSKGWSCPTRDWQTGIEWVTGGFER